MKTFWPRLNPMLRKARRFVICRAPSLWMLEKDRDIQEANGSLFYDADPFGYVGFSYRSDS